MTLGISGHQHIGAPATAAWVEATILEKMAALPPGCAMSSLAAGSDQLFARLAIKLRWKLLVIVPCIGYEATFDAPYSLEEFRSLIRQAHHTHTLAFETPSETAFWEAGMYVVDHCDLMFFVWNEEPARGLGGTADVVNYARKKAVPYVHINPKTRSVKTSGVSSSST